MILPIDVGCSSFQEFGNTNGSPIQVHTRPFEISKGNSKFDVNLKLNLLNFENHGQLEDHGLP
jgi:hypothetical protein